MDLESWGTGASQVEVWAGARVRSLRMAGMAVPQGQEGLSPRRRVGGAGRGRSREAGVEVDTEPSLLLLGGCLRARSWGRADRREPERKGTGASLQWTAVP